MRRHPNLCDWVPHTSPDDLIYGIACYSQYGSPQPPLMCPSMHCLQACGSYMHALMKHYYRLSSGHTVTVF